MTSTPPTPAEQDAARSAAQASLRQRAVQIAGGIVGTSMISLLAAGAALPLLSAPAATLVGLGGNALASWLVEWAKQRMQAVGALASEITLDDLARAIDVHQQADVQIAADVEHLLSTTQAVATLLDALNGQTERQTRLLQLLAEDLQQATVRNERLHDATYQEVIRLRDALTQSHAELTTLVAAILAAPRNTTFTGGGDYAEGNIDKRTGTFIEQQTVLPPRPASAPAFQVPYPLAPLVGRSADLAELAKLLLAEQPVALTPAIAGMGGVGKTMLAATFARQHQADFPGGIFWLNMEQPDSIAGQVAACAGPDGLDLAAYEQLSFEERILRTKAAWNGSERRLLVFDNLEDPALLKQWLPTGSGSRVLITTRRDDWPRLVRRLRLPVLSRPQSIELLLGARAEDLGRPIAELLNTPENQREADTIGDLLGDLPLALAIAAAFLRLSPSTTLRRYREQIEADPLASEYQLDATMREILAEAGLPTGRERGIMATFAFSYQQLTPDNPTDALALTMFHAAAYCAPAPIPQAVLWWVGNVADDDAETRTRRDSAIRRLRVIGLLTIESAGEPPPVSVHRLIAAYLRSLLNGEDIQRTLCVALTNAGHAAVNSGIPHQSAPLVAHMLHVAVQPHENDAASGALYGALARVHEQQSNYAEAQPLLQRALAIAETALGPQHPDTAGSLNNLAFLYSSTGNYAEAQPLYQRALAIRETALGPQHPQTATSLNNLAELYSSTGNYAEAQPLYQRALAICETALGPLHPDTAQSLNNLAELYRATGNYAEALPLFQRALAIYETAFGPQHPQTALSLNNLAALYYATGSYAEAQPLYQRALAICETVLGPQHPQTAGSLNNLAFLYSSTGNYAESLPLFQRALAIAETVLGPQHPQTATSLNNLAELYRTTGNYAEAQPLYQRALAICETALGPQHPQTALSLNNLALLYSSTGNYAEALPLYQRALAIAEAAQGATHPSTGTSLNNLAYLYQAMGEYAKALPLLQRALAICEQRLGSSHPTTVTVRANYQRLLQEVHEQQHRPFLLDQVVQWLRRKRR